MATKSIYEKAMNPFHQGAYTEALKGFKTVIADLPNDAATLNYIDRATEYINNGLPSDFEGVETLDFKTKR